MAGPGRIIGAVVYILGLIAGLITVWNINFSEALTGQIVVGGLGVLLAFLFTITLQENPSIQRLAVYGLMGLSGLMLLPPLLQLFTGNTVTLLGVATAFLGGVLLFITWRMLPR